ncbi:hypothetical protein [Pseudomonas fluorescens]|uniref:hypothetical protein n=1 Tax=Pseudomonas fluorescens TaxID=294 RepID=UPI000694E643|nr:hypothetical protein [Pseudomonas fluorescens]
MTTDLHTACDDFDKALENLLSMNSILREDLDALLDVFKDDHSNQVLRRNLVRASWAYVEAITYALKHMTSIIVDAGAYELETKQAEFLEDERTDTLKNVKETIKLVAKVFKVPERDLGGGTDWCNVKPTLKIRDRLVHPKSAEELRIEDSEWEAHKNCFVWLVRAFDGLLSDINDQYSQRQCKDTPKA